MWRRQDCREVEIMFWSNLNKCQSEEFELSRQCVVIECFKTGVCHDKAELFGNSLPVQWLVLHTSTAGGMGSIPGWGTKTHMSCGAAKKKKKAELFEK